MALGSTVKRSVREQLESQFDTYLGQVVSYLKDGYRELGFSAELVEEIAATVIVRVSHSNPEPENLEQALFASADDVVRARRPRLSQQKMVERINGAVRSEIPAALPSLRLIQRLSRVPANTDDVITTDGLESLGRLSLPKPPVDLQASLNTMDFNGAKELEGASIPSAQIPSLKHEPRFQPVIPSYDDSLDELTSLREKPKANEPGELERELDEQLTGTVLIPKIQFLSEENDDPADQAPVGMRQPSILAANEPADPYKGESSRVFFDIPIGSLESPKLPVESTMAGVQLEPVVSAVPPSASSIPPTKESMVPSALEEVPGLFSGPVAQAKVESPVAPTPKTSRPSRNAEAKTTAAKKSALQALASDNAPENTAPEDTAPANRQPKFKTKAQAPAKAASKTKAQKKHQSVASPQTAAQSFGILPDELSMLSMVGFPDNPQRAARLCVASLADELGISSSDGFRSLALMVEQALEDLRQGYTATGQVGSHAALQWQRVARHATLRAFLTR